MLTQDTKLSKAVADLDGAPPRPAKDDPRQIVVGATVASAVLAASIVIYAFQPSGPGLSAIGTGLAIAGGALAVGGFLGLLFGIPRALQQPTPSAPDKTPGDGAGSAPNQSPYGPNTNLTEISDWLTKIIVGVSLIQLGAIRDEAGHLVTFLSAGFGAAPSAGPFVAGLLAMASVTGFLAGYLLARLYLPKALRTADTVELREAARLAVQSVVDQAQLDAEAIRIIDQQLNPPTGIEPPSAAEIEQAIRTMSVPLRQTILNRTAQVRRDNWENDKERMERTIPILRAFIKTDERPQYWTIAQLGYALKDKAAPDNPGAIAELTKAIDLRDRSGAAGDTLFEFARAVARARMSPATGSGQAAAADREAILADLSAVAADPWARGYVARDEEIKAWMTRNKVDPDKL